MTAAWAVLAATLLLVAFGSNLGAAAARVLLAVVTKCGLLSNIRIGDATHLSVRVTAVQFSFWKELWAFLHAPAQTPLLCIDVPEVHVHIMRLAPPCDAPTARTSSAPSSQDTPEDALAQLAVLLDLTTSFKSMHNALWTSVRAWLHRLNIVCYFVHLVAIRVTGVTVTIGNERSKASPLVTITHGSVRLHANYNSKPNELLCAVTLSHADRSLECCVPSIDGSLSLGRTELKVWIPVTQGLDDDRAPIPTSCSITCDAIAAQADVVMCAGVIGTQDREKPDATASGSASVATPESLHASSLLVLRLAEALPDEIALYIRTVEIKLCLPSNSSSGNCRGSLSDGSSDVVCALSNVSLRAFDPRSRLLGAHPHASDGSVTEERKVTFELGALRLGLEAPHRELAPLLKLSALKVDLEVKLAASIDIPFPADDDALETSPTLSCSARLSGETRGLSVTISSELEPWVSQAHATLTEDQRRRDSSASVDSLSFDLSGPHPLWSCAAIELEIQVKVLQTQVLLQALENPCVVLPSGVPDLLLTAEEINVFAHPFVSEQTLGVRSKADIQCSRLKILSCARDQSAKTCFISLDFTRVFIEPMSLMNTNQSAADVEMEAEWLEVKWTPEAMHAIGGMLELGVFIASAFLRESPGDVVDWDVEAKTHIQPLKTIDDVCADKLADSESVAFRCTVKRTVVFFAYSVDERRHVDYVTVESFTMSVEETTGRFRIAVHQTKVYYVESDTDRSVASPTFASQRPPRRTTSTFASMHAGARAAAGSVGKRGKRPPGFPSAGDRAGGSSKTHALPPYFTVQTFALEETKLPHCPKTVVDIFVDAVHGDWDLATQLRITELVRQITFATWEMLYALRRGYAVHCTPPASRYNRLGGVNPPMNDAAERDRCANLLTRLVSATGDTLNRLYATNVHLSARFASDTHVQLHLGVFSGDDLPELWTFRAISLRLNALELLAIDTVRVRHTVEKRRDYVFGEFEAMLALRIAACSCDMSNHARRDGMLVDVDGIRARVSTQVPLLNHMARVHASVAPFLPALETAMGKNWRPQHEVFFQYFLRTPVVLGRPQLWLSITSLTLECLDTPLESWLERIYPLWLEELQEHELRAQVLDDQVLALKLTNADVLCSDDALDEMKALLTEKNAKIYVQKARKLHAAYAQSRDSDAAASGVLLRLQIGHIGADVTFESDKRETLRRMRSLDEASDVVASVFARSNREFTHYAPVYDVLEGIKLSVAVNDVAVQVRSFATPLFFCSSLSLAGDVVVAASTGPARDIDSTAARLGLLAGLRTFTDLSVRIVGPVAFFSPSYAYTLDELAGWMQSLLPLLLFDVDKELETPLWDIGRRLVHGSVHVTLQDATVRLLCSPTSFSVSDYVEVALGRLELAYAFEKTTVSLQRLTAKIDPGSLSNIVEFSNATIEIWTKWTSGDSASSVHFGFPLEYRAIDSDGSVTDCVYLDAWASRVLTLEQWRASHVAFSNRHPLKHYEATGLSVFVRGTVCPWSLSAAGADVSTIKRTKHEVATRTAIVLYTKHIEWLIRFASLYSMLPRYPFPRRRRRQQQRHQRSSAESLAPQASLVRILKALVVEEFTVVGLDLAVYHSEKNPIGIRAFVNDHVAISGAVVAATHELFRPLPQTKKASKPRRLVVPFNGKSWVVHDVTVAVQDIQVRICTHTSGSRGESLVSVKHMTLKVGGGSEIAPTHDNSNPRSAAQALDAVLETRTESPPTSRSADDTRVRTKKNILEHFAIAQHNPYCFRDSDTDPRDDGSVRSPAEIEKSDEQRYQAGFVDEFRRLGFLMGLSAREARILVTISAVEALVDIVENWIQIATVCVPELFGLSGDGHSSGDEKLASLAGVPDDLSPKKITSLTDDPKFGAIFYESVVRDEANSFVTRLARPSFLVSDAASASAPLRDESDARGDSDAASGAAPTGASIVESFFMVKFMDCQVSVQDRIHKASALLALNCGTLKDSTSSDACHELIDLKVDGLQLFTAPLDIDVKSRIVWLKTLPDGSYCPSSYGLLQQVIAPIPTKVVIWVDRSVTVSNKVDLQVPTVQVRLTVASKDMLQHLATALTDVVTAKICAKSTRDYSKTLQSALVAAGRDRAHGASRSSLRALKRELTWKIAELQWRQLCRWSYYVSERANVAFAAAESSRTLAFDVETSPLFRRRKVSSASMSSALSTTMSLSGSGTAHGDVDQHSDELQRLTQQLAAVSDALQSAMRAEQKRMQTLPNVELEFHLQTASLTLSGAHMDIVRASLSSLRFKMKQFEDQSGACTLTLQDLSAQNLCPGTPYPDLLQASATSNTWGGGNAFLRIDAEVAAPVAGVTVVKHFELNVHPLQVCITQEVILHLVAFFTSSSATDSSQDAHVRDEVRSTFLQARPAASATDGLVGSALKKAARVAGKAAHPLGRSRAAPKDESESASGAAPSAAAARRSRSFTAVHDDDATAWATNAASVAASHQANETQLLLQSDADFARPRGKDAAPGDAADVRTQSAILFKRIRIGTVEVVVTYKHKKTSSSQQTHQPLEDMRGFAVKVHALVYCDKTCSMSDLLLRIRRDVILDVLSQVGRNFTNIATFLRDQVDLTRWGQFDALAPLKTLSTTVTSLASAATSPLSAVAPAPGAGQPNRAPGEPSPRLCAATAPAAAAVAPVTTPATASSGAQDTAGAHKFQLELPETHRALRKKHAAASVRTAEAVHRVSGSGSASGGVTPSPAPSPRRESPGDDSDSEQQHPRHKDARTHRSTAGKAKHAIAHLFSKKRAGSTAVPLSPTKAPAESTDASDTQVPSASAAGSGGSGSAISVKSSLRD